MSDRAIENPVGAIEPTHVGQMFFDAFSEVFYQARGPTAFDWKIVPPDDMLGSFVKVYDHFLGLPQDDDPEVGRNITASETVRKTMMLDGVDVMQTLAWKTAAGADVMIARLRFDRLADLTLFAGFAADARAHALPNGIGIIVENGIATFGDSAEHAIEPGEHVAVRVEFDQAGARAYLRDRLIGSLALNVIAPVRPVVALLNLGDGPRPHAPNYGDALKEKLKG